VFDKRGAGQSTGDWKTITYKGLADDYLAAVRFLQAQSGVNPKQVGIFGHSQGGTISPLNRGAAWSRGRKAKKLELSMTE
jgi:cephalosporin-C deacetylase-like acetyl esterase